MSRSNVLKSRADKPSVSRLASTTVTNVIQEIIPGKLTAQDWGFIVERDDGVDFVAKLLEEWYAGVDRIIYNNYIQQQLVPYTVSRSKDDILQIIEWQFLARDDGEPVDEVDGGWTPDTEPEAAPMDRWAQGAVPKTTSFSPRLASLGSEDAIADSARQPFSPSEPGFDNVGDNLLVNYSDHQSGSLLSGTGENVENIDANEPLATQFDGDSSNSKLTTTVRLKEPSNERRKVKLPKQRLAANATPNIAKDSAETQQNVENYSPPSYKKQQPVSKLTKTVQSEDNQIRKIPPHKLPTNRVNAVFCLVDPSQQEAKETLRNGRRPLKTLKKSSKFHVDMNGEQVCAHFVEVPSTFHPMLIDTMDPATGVVIRDSNNRVKKGPKQRRLPEADLLRNALSHGLQPVKGPRKSFSDLPETLVPIVRPVVETHPIPPINQSI